MRKPPWLTKELWEEIREHWKTHRIHPEKEEEALSVLVRLGLETGKILSGFWQRPTRNSADVALVIVPREQEARVNQLLREEGVHLSESRPTSIWDDENPF